ncbi:Muscarinic acetylcholine receptor M2 [Galemys pyrenaicus]|uniref:Muscarinic acetylcholine receptor n=1 Tax=Galemys pyrenaicus TaxID=202257 RepID=A0A8J6DZJ0_GALPY|nr:Muscarinic acetylcholine receptor M2 [Galemys pyrenaicus]
MKKKVNVYLTTWLLVKEHKMNNSTNSSNNGLALSSPYKTFEVVFIVLVAGSLSLVTIIGNILVMVSIKVNRHLQTVNNYFLFSLACADLIIGVFSMNLYTLYTVIGYWPLGPVVCDLWLALDYVVSNASVMNLLIISFDRYFCVTKPLTYPVKRTTKMAGMMIAAAWVLSFILWAPAILFWQFIVGVRTVKDGECYIQFFSNAAVTFGTAIAAFYLPVIIMTVLYWHISRASKSRIKKDKKEPVANQDPVSPSLVQGRIVKPNTTTMPCTDDGLEHSKVQNGKAPRDAVTENCVQGEEKESSNDSTSVSAVASNMIYDEITQDENTISTSLGCSKDENSKQTCIKIVTKTQKGDSCTPTNTTVELVGSSGQNGDEKQNMLARKIVKMTKQPAKKKPPPSREKKVTRTILAILLAFIITWAPYNVMVLINTFCAPCIPNTVWTIGYWLCYINSTINPACYALCNATFKKTFKHLLMCHYKNIGATSLIMGCAIKEPSSDTLTVPMLQFEKLAPYKHYQSKITPDMVVASTETGKPPYPMPAASKHKAGSRSIQQMVKEGLAARSLAAEAWQPEDGEKPGYSIDPTHDQSFSTKNGRR